MTAFRKTLIKKRKMAMKTTPVKPPFFAVECKTARHDHRPERVCDAAGTRFVIERF
jgi:hypothetical protein